MHDTDGLQTVRAQLGDPGCNAAPLSELQAPSQETVFLQDEDYKKMKRCLFSWFFFPAMVLFFLLAFYRVCFAEGKAYSVQARAFVPVTSPGP